ncbi:hypothetical protein GW17_00048686 [Ensete ventricosum]|nr:hypothetical protein GW17_00048686 [Ensete ventricosum]
MQLGTHLECIESSPKVSGACQDGTREFAGRRLRLTGGNRKAYRDETHDAKTGDWPSWNTIGVPSSKCVEGIGSLPGWRKGVRQKKTVTRQKIVKGRRKACRETNYDRSNGVTTDDGPRSNLSLRLRFGRCSGISSEFARRFAEGIGKLTGNMSGDCRKKTIGLIARMSEATGLAGVELNWLTRGLVNIMFKPEFEKWREPLLRKFRRVNRR